MVHHVRAYQVASTHVWPPQGLNIPPLLFDGVAVTEVEEIKLLGVTFDRQLTFAPHLQQVAVKARQRLGFLRRASRVLRRAKDRTIAYKAFVRPRLEYAPLAWMGAAPTHLEKLDAVQHAAERLIGDNNLALDSLVHRRYVAALTYLYKLQGWPSCPAALLAMIPPCLPLPDMGRTRASLRAHREWHPAKLQNPLPPRSTIRASTAFPFGVLDKWNNLPA